MQPGSIYIFYFFSETEIKFVFMFDHDCANKLSTPDKCKDALRSLQGTKYRFKRDIEPGAVTAGGESSAPARPLPT